MRKSKLLPREESEKAKREYRKRPVTLELSDGDKKLFYFGANHSRDPDNFQYKELKKYWRKFLEETKENDKIVLLEGVPSKVSENEREAIKEGAESSFMTLLSKNFVTKCADLSLEDGVKKT